MNNVRIQAPAKINLGLSILGKRDDGYHEIDTIMAMIDVVDEIEIIENSKEGISIRGMDNVPPDTNLMTKAALLWSDSTGIKPTWQISITKRIPAAAGLGGGSSDAAAVLRALNLVYHRPLDDQRLQQIAAEIGADCPFFLSAPVARATGIGTTLRPLPAIDGFVVLAVPPIEAVSKTASMYAALDPQDYGTRRTGDAIENTLRHATIPGHSLFNSFARAALNRFSAVRAIENVVLEQTGSWNLSGAGPASYAIARDKSEADVWANGIRQRVSAGTRIIVAGFLSAIPEAETFS